jgi:hypothetical protein
MTECAVYFTKTLAAVHPDKLFHIPSWILRLSDPQVEFDLDPPSYQQVTAVTVNWKNLVLLVLSIKYQSYALSDVLT